MNSATPLAIQVQSVTKSFLGQRALDDIDFEVARGEVHGLVGKNGAGKSTFMKILSGAQPPDSGQIIVGGTAFKALNPAEGRAAGIAIVYQNPELHLDLSVAANIFLGAEPRKGFGVLDDKAMAARATELLARLGLDLPVNRRLGDLDIADRQQVAIAKVPGKDEILRRTDADIGGAALVLRPRRDPPGQEGRNRIDKIGGGMGERHGISRLRKGDLRLRHDGSGIDHRREQMERDAGRVGGPIEDHRLQRRRTAISRQERGVEVEGPARKERQHLRRDDMLEIGGDEHVGTGLPRQSHAIRPGREAGNLDPRHAGRPQSALQRPLRRDATEPPIKAPVIVVAGRGPERRDAMTARQPTSGHRSRGRGRTAKKERRQRQFCLPWVATDVVYFTEVHATVDESKREHTAMSLRKPYAKPVLVAGPRLGAVAAIVVDSNLKG